MTLAYPVVSVLATDYGNRVAADNRQSSLNLLAAHRCLVLENAAAWFYSTGLRRTALCDSLQLLSLACACHCGRVYIYSCHI